MSNLNSLKLCVRREYWEYRSLLLRVPIALAGLILVASIMVNLFAEKIAQWEDEKSTQITQSAVPEAEQQSSTNPEQIKTPTDIDTGEDIEVSGHPQVEFVGIFLKIAWLLSAYYLLSCLYLDRKDNSILYWKSMPVSETQTVLTKFVFGVFGFMAVAIAAAWATNLLIELLSLDDIPGRDHESFNAAHLFIWPVVGSLVAVLWSAPLLTFLMLVSAAAKRSRFLLLLTPIFLIAVLEGIIFQRRNFLEYIAHHSPISVLEVLETSPGLGSFVTIYLRTNLTELLLGLGFSAIFFVAAVWCRNNRFEAA